jgi:4-hydroxy-tetrahydrodipicolinate reductase
MGQSIAALAAQDASFTITGAVEAPGHPAIGQPLGRLLGRPNGPDLRVVEDAAAAFAGGDVVVEFTAPEATIQHAELAARQGIAMVVGTTGLSTGQQEALRTAARKIAIVFSPNMSVGVNVLFEVARVAAERLGASFDASIVESHHRQKQDAPSGTAKLLAQVLEAARRERSGVIPVHAVRAGGIIGDHTVILAGSAERLELTHRAQSRDVFAQGALRAAQFVVSQPPGLYEMSHVLRAGLR